MGMSLLKVLHHNRLAHSEVFVYLAQHGVLNNKSDKINISPMHPHQVHMRACIGERFAPYI